MNQKEETELGQHIRKIALLNAIKHNGTAKREPVIGKLLGEKPELRPRVKELAELVNIVVHEVNHLSLNEQKRIVDEKWPEVLIREKREGKKNLPPLPNVDRYGEIITRFSPNPDCVLHLGSARAIILCYEYAHMYSGRFLLRFEDTDPKLKKPVLEFYDRIRQDMTWLGCKPDEEFIQSDRIHLYYKYAERLLKEGKAYVCTCKSEEFRKKVTANNPCVCRGLATEEQLRRWELMLQGDYREREAVVRIKTDLEHPNPAVRDWPALRVINAQKHPHPRVGSKYHVWPLYNFATGIDDHFMGITHIIRGKEHLTNMVRQTYMYRHLGWEYPEAIHYGRLKITGASLSKSKIIQGIRDGFYRSWDDPRLATFASLRRRGMTPEAIRRLIIDVGPKTSDVTLSWENLYAHNRKILDPQANRYFFVHNPVQLIVENIPKKIIAKLCMHPDHPERGLRKYKIEPKGNGNSAPLWISRNDVQVMKVGGQIRLMGLFNLRIKRANVHTAEASFISESYDEARKAAAPLIHWIPVGEDVPCQVVMPDTTLAEGIAESACKRLRPNDVVQFERFGFVRIDQLDTKLTAYYTHR